MDISALKAIIMTIFLGMARMTAAFSVVPFFDKRMIQGIVRNSILLSFMLILYPMVAPTVPADISSFFLLAVILAKEILIGILIGFLTGIVFWAAESVGFFIDNQRGTTMASVMDPMSGEQTSPLGSMILQVVTVLFFSSGGFLILLSTLFESYRVWPIATFYPSFDPEFARFALQQADRLMRLTVILASPVIIVLFISELGLGLINRFAPQLNVFFLSMPIKSGIASFFLVLYLSTLLLFFKKELAGTDRLLDFLKAVIGAQ